MNMIHDDARRGGSAAEALAFIDQSRGRLAAASETPASRHFVFAAMMGGLVVTPAIPIPWRFAALALIFVAMALVFRWDRRRTGMFINGYRAGRTRKVTAAVLLTILPLYILSCWFGIERHEVLPSIGLAAVAGALAYAGSIWWCRVFRREMLGGAA